MTYTHTIAVPMKMAKIDDIDAIRYGQVRGGSKIRVKIAREAARELGLAAGVKVEVSGATTYFVASVRGTVTGFGQTWERKGVEYLYTYIEVDTVDSQAAANDTPWGIESKRFLPLQETVAETGRAAEAFAKYRATTV